MTTTGTRQRQGGRMRRGWERVRSEPGLGRNVAWLTGLVVIAALVGGYILDRQRVAWPWDEKKIIFATFAGTPGVSPDHGQEVRIAGVPVGEIRSVSLDDDGHAKVEMTIEPDQKVYDNATVVLRPKSPLNEMYIVLDPGTDAGGELRDGATLPVTASRRPVQIDEVLGHLDANSREALGSLLVESDAALASAPSALPDGLRKTTSVLRNLQPVAKSLSQRRKAVSQLVTALSRISAAVGKDDVRLARLASGLQTTLGTMGHRSGALDSVLGQLPDLNKQLKGSSDAVQGLSDELDPTLDDVRSASGELPKALRSVTGTADRLTSTMDTLGPFVRKARPVVGNLRPLTVDFTATMHNLKKSTAYLDPVTSVLVRHLNELGAFFVNTRSVAQLVDGNGGFIRAQVAAGSEQVPLKTPLLGPKKGR